MEEPQVITTGRWAAAVIMERVPLNNRWVSEKWEARGVVPDVTSAAGPRVIVDTPERRQILHPGLAIDLHRDEAEGYLMNLSSTQPRVFVLWRMEDEVAVPQMLTVSYHEGARWMDSGETVDGVPLPIELVPWIAQFAEAHYKPEPRKKTKYATNKDKGRMGNWRPE